MLRLLRRFLSSARRGYHVVTASNGKEALRIMRRQKPDAILLDLYMPEMDGFALLAEMGQDPALRNTPVVVITARDPMEQPAVSSTLALVKAGGLSTHQLVACIDAIQRICSTGP